MPTLMIVEMHPIVNCCNQFRFRCEHVPVIVLMFETRPQRFATPSDPRPPARTPAVARAPAQYRPRSPTQRDHDRQVGDDIARIVDRQRCPPRHQHLRQRPVQPDHPRRLPQQHRTRSRDQRLAAKPPTTTDLTDYHSLTKCLCCPDDCCLTTSRCQSPWRLEGDRALELPRRLYRAASFPTLAREKPG